MYSQPQPKQPLSDAAAQRAAAEKLSDEHQTNAQQTLAAQLHRSPQAVMQRVLNTQINQSPRLIEQQVSTHAVLSSPQLVAQGRFSSIVQRHADPANVLIQAASKSPTSTVNAVAQLNDYFVDRFGADIMDIPIGTLRSVIDDTNVPEKERVRAEGLLIQHEPLLAEYRQMQVHEVLELIRTGNYQEALDFIVSMMGINLNGATIAPVQEWTDVVDESEVPRAGGLGVTLPGVGLNDPPRIYIKEAVMDRWSSTMEFGNLAATIAHEAVHAGQKARGEAEDDIHYKEFEAHANEICDAHYRILNNDKEFFPSGSHMKTAYEKATEHFGDIKFGTLAPALVLKANALKVQMDKKWRVVKHYTIENDMKSGLSALKVKKVESLRDQLKELHGKAEFSSDKKLLTELKNLATIINQNLGLARGDMTKPELKMIDKLEDEMDDYSSYFNRNMKFIGL